jgi:hypothetical protein
MATIRDKYILEIDVQNGLRGLNSVTGAADNLGRSLGGIKGLAAGAAGALATIGGVNLASSAIEQYQAYELLNTQLVTYLGSQQAASAEMERLQGLANSLPQDLEDVASAFTILTRTGIDTSSEALTAFSNIATANGKSLEQLAEAVADGMTGEFERFKEFGIKVSKEGENLVATIGNQQVALAGNSTDLINQLVALGEEGGKFGGAAAANADTLSQSFSNLQGALFEASVAFGEGIKPGLQDVTAALTVFISENEATIESVGRFIGEALSGLIEILPTVIESLKPLQPVFQLLGTLLTEVVGPALTVLFELFGLLAEAINPIVEFAIPALQAGFNGIIVIIETLVAAFQGVIDGLGRIYEEAVRLKDATVGAFNSMADGVTNAASNAYDGVTGYFGDMYDYVVGNSVVPDMVEGVLGEFLKMNTGIDSNMSQINTNTANQFDTLGGFIAQKFQELTGISLSGISNLVGQSSTGLLGYLDQLTNGIVSKFGNVVSSVSGIFSGLGKGTGGGAFGGLTSLFGGIGDLFAGFFADGGFIPRGQFGIVGERGPELISGPANITPMTTARTTEVIYNINAVDAQSFQQLLARDPSFIHALAVKGSRSIPGGR